MNTRSLKGFRIAATLATVLVAALVAGCVSSPEKDSQAVSKTEAATKVKMSSVLFSPREVTVAVGSTIEWVNEDAMPHDVTGKDKAWQSAGAAGGMGQGATFSKTFHGAGVYEYYCTLHSSGPGNGMWGKVTVK
ncbi:MAG: cupredoxin domain-containing protein [Euryarchaeota archaeon]|nr:cupredoxin domain-containing protein [Euryarchaeota archaeon]